MLSCSSADLAACDSIRSFSYVGFGAAEPESKSDGTDVGVEDVVAMPAFGTLAFADYAGEMGGAYGMTYDSIPAGSAELRRDSIVVTESQEMIGNVDGLLLEGTRLTHVLLRHPGRGRPRPAPDSGRLGRLDRHRLRHRHRFRRQRRPDVGAPVPAGLTWLGHSCVEIRLDDQLLVTDPVLRCADLSPAAEELSRSG